MNEQERLTANLKKLPVTCYFVPPENLRHPHALIRIVRGEAGFYPADNQILKGETPEQARDRLNNQVHGNTNPKTLAAMFNGSLFGFHNPGADPDMHDAEGKPLAEKLSTGVLVLREAQIIKHKGDRVFYVAGCGHPGNHVHAIVRSNADREWELARVLESDLEPCEVEPERLPADFLPPGPMTGLTEADIHAQDAAAEAEEPESDYPEHDKMSAIKAESQAVGAFLEWLEEEKGWQLAEPHAHTDECYTQGFTPKEFRRAYGSATGSGIASDEEGQAGRFNTPQCHLGSGQLIRANFSIEKLLAEHFEIDLRKIEFEKRAMLAALRKG